MILSLFIGFILGASALLFALQNNDLVALTFLGWQFTTSLALLVLVSVTVGVLISILAYIPSAVGNYLTIGKLRKQNKMLAQEAEAKQQDKVKDVPDEDSTVIDLRT